MATAGEPGSGGGMPGSKILGNVIDRLGSASDVLQKRLDDRIGAPPNLHVPQPGINRRKPPPDPMLRHVVGSYLGLHIGTFWIAFLFPLAVVIAGFLLSVPMQNSLSAYFFALTNGGGCEIASDDARQRFETIRMLTEGGVINVKDESHAEAVLRASGITKDSDLRNLVCALIPPKVSTAYRHDLVTVFPVRIVFTGFLFAIAACLYFYKGFSPLENILLNIAAIGAMGVALAPEAHDLFNSAWWNLAHFGFVGLLFGMVAIVCWRCSEITLRELPDDASKRRYRGTYALCSLVMVLVLIAGLVIFLAGWHDIPFVVLVLEFAAIWAFALYWLIKNREMREHPLMQDYINGVS